MVEMRIVGEDKLFRVLDNLGSKQNRSDLMDRIGAFGVSTTQENFLSEKSPTGEPWLKSRRAIDDAGSTLRDTNMLFQSLTHEHSDDHAAWGSNKIYAGIHQFGGVITPKNAKALAFHVGQNFVLAQSVTIPQREYLGLSQSDEREIEFIVHDWLTETLQ